ncbi:phenol 2-monooxygenase [Phlyctema vagabunda]|uniref:Phenol 2-monooxygenase n=1 Tax=Phlyctema vagabunda TaxID=108571 RepID=A0ABR4PES9_9HELO
MIQKVSVLICGSGSAGLCAGLWLSRYNIPCTILDSRTGPLEKGQADGVQCRTVEVFDSFGIAEELLREAYHVVEDVFWADHEGRIVRTKRTADTAPGLSIQPHVILNQARVNALMLGAMGKSGQQVSYGYRVLRVWVDEALVGDEEAHPVIVTTEKDGKEEIFHARYVLGCDGAHSAVRRSLGISMVGDSSDSVWGVMDIYPQTDFPDIRKKCIIHSSSGSLFIIPREGDSLVRFYIQLPAGTVAKEVQLEGLYATAKKIFHPYTMDFAANYWWSAYSIGQRLAEKFHVQNRVFLLGDACHTHSPKAGQGMNTSLQDGYNIGWKLGSLLSKRAPSTILRTYVQERERVASDLIDFDRRMTGMLASSSEGEEEKSSKSERFAEMFIQTARYTAGLTATYEDSTITSLRSSKRDVSNLEVGMRLPTVQVLRWSDAKPMQVVKAMPADGRWRVLIFAGDIVEDGDARARLDRFTTTLAQIIATYTPSAADVDSVIEPLLILSGSRTSLEMENVPGYYLPITGPYKMRNLQKIFFDDETYNAGFGDAYKFYAINPARGALVIVRPDHYTSMVTDLDDDAQASVTDFFSGTFLRP